MCAKPPKDTTNQPPRILKPWIHAYRSSPKLYLPGTDVDIAFSLICALLFSLLRLTIRHTLYQIGWKISSPDTFYASACIASFLHASTLLPLLAAILSTQTYVPSEQLHIFPQWYQDAVHAIMSFCTGYMIADSIMGYLVETWQPGIGPILTSDDWMFLIHHVVTVLYMVSARWIKAGHMSAMMLMFNGELSAPVMNVYLLLEKALAQDNFRSVAWLPTAFVYVEQLFCVVYLVCRVPGPCFVHPRLSYQLLFTKKGREDVPLWLSICWMPLCWSVWVGSIPWIRTCWEILKNGPLFGGAGGDRGEL